MLLVIYWIILSLSLSLYRVWKLAWVTWWVIVWWLQLSFPMPAPSSLPTVMLWSKTLGSRKYVYLKSIPSTPYLDLSIGPSAQYPMYPGLLIRYFLGKAHLCQRLEHPGPSLWCLLNRKRSDCHHQSSLASHGRPTGTSHQMDQKHGKTQGECSLDY